ncbi:MAG TPA: hypothetical protein ENI80_07800 [Acidiferrobacteraceae bacterium]|nr:hypothetical protein [Acidiferrobacteraceae bacterium]
MKALLITTMLVGLYLQYYYLPQLPDYVAVNFGDGGVPNAWHKKDANVVIGGLSLIVNTVVFLLMPVIFSRFPVRLISFPKREYWLAEERKAQSIRSMSAWMQFFGVFTNCFIIAVTHLVFMANISDPVRLNNDHFFSMIGLYVLVLVVWLKLLYGKFNKIPPQSGLTP